MSRIATNLLLALAITIVCGCASRRQCPPPDCAPFASQKSIVHVSPKSSDGVTSDFGAIPAYDSVRKSLFDQIASGGSVSIDLQEAMCLAARNSDVADLIESERHAIGCQSAEELTGGIDLILQGESLEQRNIAAAAAGEVFLRLAEVNLQRGSLEETKQHLAELDETILAADEAGFATADAKNELAEGRIIIKRTETQLSSSEQKLLYKLNQLINIDSDNLINFQVVHLLRPREIPFDVRQQTELATANRPGVRAAEMARENGVGTDSLYQLLRQFDSRLGIRLPPASIKKMLLRRTLLSMLERDEQPNPAAETRQGQLQQLIDARRKTATAEASEALLGIQSALEKLAITQENIARLNAKAEQLSAKKEIEAEESFMESNLNWIERQEAKSKRISLAIEHEISMVKLFQAQGELARECGFDLQQRVLSDCGCE